MRRVVLLLLHLMMVAASLPTPIILGAESAAQPPIKDLGEGRVQIGAVTLDRKTKSLTFPAVINMTTGLVEYAIVTVGGKVHESLLRTEAEPYHLHTAMLLLGAKLATNTETAAFFDPKSQIPGSHVKVEIAIAGHAKVAPIQTFLAHAQSKAPVKPNEIPHWVYNGSRFVEAPADEAGPAAAPGEKAPERSRTFLAQREGSIISLIADPAALINNPRGDRENDELWILHTPQIPPAGTSVQVRVALE